jgi:hypothetical protein
MKGTEKRAQTGSENQQANSEQVREVPPTFYKAINQ